MNNIVSLNKIDTGKNCFVKEILFNNKEKIRLYDLGIIENTSIRVLYRSPFNDPTAYLIRGTVLALRKDDAEKILVYEECSNGIN